MLAKSRNSRPEVFLKKLFSEISQKFCEIFKDTFFHRVPLVAASASHYVMCNREEGCVIRK